jgi:hypothetical protein
VHDHLLAALERAAPVEALRGSAWGYPLLEVGHLLGVALLVGPIIAIDLRLLGRGADLPATVLAAHLLPLAWIGFALAGLTGLALFAVSATSYAANPVFWAKMAVIAGAGVNVLALHRHDGVAALQGGARAAAAASLLLWILAVGLGRAIAYW